MSGQTSLDEVLERFQGYRTGLGEGRSSKRYLASKVPPYITLTRTHAGNGLCAACGFRVHGFQRCAVECHGGHSLQGAKSKNPLPKQEIQCCFQRSGMLFIPKAKIIHSMFGYGLSHRHLLIAGVLGLHSRCRSVERQCPLRW